MDRKTLKNRLQKQYQEKVPPSSIIDKTAKEAKLSRPVEAKVEKAVSKPKTVVPKKSSNKKVQKQLSPYSKTIAIDTDLLEDLEDLYENNKMSPRPELTNNGNPFTFPEFKRLAFRLGLKTDPYKFTVLKKSHTTNGHITLSEDENKDFLKFKRKCRREDINVPLESDFHSNKWQIRMLITEGIIQLKDKYL